ncbi:MAG TPA: hypothetical protein VK553_12155 [Candidatus Nitrosopolaris rasttigaisensis]|nr:hypothetical protein [Candidatus Nitrosopolaris rasttigaisensis]
MTRLNPINDQSYQPAKTGNPINPEITLGEEVCLRLKSIYFSHVHWAECVNEVANMFTKLKKIGRIYHPDLKNDELIKCFRKWTNEDIKEALT